MFPPFLLETHPVHLLREYQTEARLYRGKKVSLLLLCQASFAASSFTHRVKSNENDVLLRNLVD
jgi:hypothetical protein